VGLPISAGGPPSSSGGDIRGLIASFRPDALRVARSLVRSEAEAEDLAQTAVMKVLARADSISDPAFVKPYLLTTVRNLWRNQLRDGRRFEPHDQSLFERIPAESAVDDPVVSALDVNTLLIAMETLSKSHRELIELRDVERLEYTDIGLRLGITPSTARQRVHRAREKLLAVCFEADPDDASDRVCRMTRFRLARFVRSALTRRISARVALHVRSCEPCRDQYAQLADLYGVPLDPDLFPESPEA
jgi:RNA polymerase sigma-70 factor (ECF subfamily)